MSEIKWTTDNGLAVGSHYVTCVPGLSPGYHQDAGIKHDSKGKLLAKRILWPLYKAHHDLFVDGFIEREIGKLIKKYITDDAVFLEIGCGDMSLRGFLPPNLSYNALDLELSEFHIRRVLRNKERVNLVIASATEIPAPSKIASLIVSTETFEHIPEIDKAIEEIHRVASVGAILICSIPNNGCYKYHKKGPHPGHINNWTYDGFVKFMKLHNFEFVEGFMKGRWIPFPLWLTRTSYHLPLTSKSEYYNTNFFYVFRATESTSSNLTPS